MELLYTVVLCLCVPALEALSGSPHSVHIEHGGLQDFDGEKEPENQLHREAFVDNKEHIQAHLKDEATINMDNASPEEVDFHFFKLHDLDDDNKLDGIELLHTISHGLEEQVNRINKLEIPAADKEARLERMKSRHVAAVDRILTEDDKNNNGYLEYVEFASSRRTTRMLNHAAKQQGLS